MKLSDLIAHLPDVVLHHHTEAEVRDVVYDSRRVGAGSLFVAIKGLTTDGNLYAEVARKKGAVAVVSEQAQGSGGPWVQVKDARQALAVLSSRLLGDPASALALVGVTGTNGKTTTAYLIDAALRAAGMTVGLLGTVQYRLGSRVAEAVRTTPEASDLQALLREMKDAGCTHGVLEVSSHSLALQRVHGLGFQVAVFTNLTRDHLDFHGDMDTYFAAKRRLFDTLLRPDGHAVLNADDDRTPELARVSRGRVLTYSLGRRSADLKAEDLSLGLHGTRFAVTTPEGRFEIASPLLGRFNVANLLAAFGAALALKVPAPIAVAGLTSISGVPGRLERVQAGQDFTVIVDYAHTDDALKNLLETMRDLKPRRLITVFGCGGDRDRTKRPLMGAVAARLSDLVVLTSDNPRSEPPEAILEEIQRGMPTGRGAERQVVVDRREAIALAVELAQPGDVVVIAGKGHEPYQMLRDRSVPFDDRQVARDALSRLARSGK